MGRAAALPAYRRVVLASSGDREDAVRGVCARVSVVIPTLNEAGNLPHVLPLLDGCEVIIVDGGSTDGTLEVARELAPEAALLIQDRRGKGNALALGIAVASREIVVTLDADGSARVEEIPAFVAALDAGADFAKGSRYLDGGGSDDFTRLRSAGNRFLGFVVNILFGTRYTDLCYGYNAFWTRHAETLSIDCDGFEVEALLHLRATRAGLKIVEIPSYEKARINGVSNLRPFRDGSRILRTILRERLCLTRSAERALLPDELPDHAFRLGSLSSSDRLLETDRRSGRDRRTSLDRRQPRTPLIESSSPTTGHRIETDRRSRRERRSGPDRRMRHSQIASAFQ
jgi:glycosyltransferase involved in cell wall biosynthesis